MCASGLSFKSMKKENENVKYVPKTQEAQNFHDNFYLPQREKIFEEIYAVMLSVLVWGPGQPGEDEYQRALFKKRIEVVNKLRELGLDAFTSEEDCPTMKVVHNSLPLMVKEYGQARPNHVELIVSIAASFGSIAEAHDFAGKPEIASKMMVFYDKEKIEAGYSINSVKESYLVCSPFVYPQDIKECHLLQEVERRVRNIQFSKYQFNKQIGKQRET